MLSRNQKIKSKGKPYKVFSYLSNNNWKSRQRPYGI